MIRLRIKFGQNNSTTAKNRVLLKNNKEWLDQKPVKVALL